MTEILQQNSEQQILEMWCIERYDSYLLLEPNICGILIIDFYIILFS